MDGVDGEGTRDPTGKDPGPKSGPSRDGRRKDRLESGVDYPVSRVFSSLDQNGDPWTGPTRQGRAHGSLDLGGPGPGPSSDPPRGHGSRMTHDLAEPRVSGVSFRFQERSPSRPPWGSHVSRAHDKERVLDG